MSEHKTTPRDVIAERIWWMWGIDVHDPDGTPEPEKWLEEADMIIEALAKAGLQIVEASRAG